MKYIFTETKTYEIDSDTAKVSNPHEAEVMFNLGWAVELDRSWKLSEIKASNSEAHLLGWK